jgi:hypothetical protein
MYRVAEFLSPNSPEFSGGAASSVGMGDPTVGRARHRQV